MSLGTIELYITILFSVIATIGSLILKKQNSNDLKIFSFFLFGITGIFLLAGLLTPPDIISNFLLSIPAIIILSTIVVVNLIRSKK